MAICVSVYMSAFLYDCVWLLMCVQRWLTRTSQMGPHHICARPEEVGEMHPGKLRDWDKQNTKLVFVYSVTGTASGSEHFKISELTELTLKFIYSSKNEKWYKRKCCNVSCWSIQYEVKTVISNTSLIPECKMLWIQNQHFWNEKYYFSRLCAALTNLNPMLDWQDMNTLCV